MHGKHCLLFRFWSKNVVMQLTVSEHIKKRTITLVFGKHTQSQKDTLSILRWLCNCSSLQIKNNNYFKHIPSVHDKLEMSWSEWCRHCLLKDRCPGSAGQSMVELTTAHLPTHYTRISALCTDSKPCRYSGLTMNPWWWFTLNNWTCGFVILLLMVLF